MAVLSVDNLESLLRMDKNSPYSLVEPRADSQRFVTASRRASGYSIPHGNDSSSRYYFDNIACEQTDRSAGAQANAHAGSSSLLERLTLTVRVILEALLQWHA